MASATTRPRTATLIFLTGSLLLLACLWAMDRLGFTNEGRQAPQYVYCTLRSASLARLWLADWAQVVAISVWLVVGGAVAFAGHVRGTLWCGAALAVWLVGPHLFAQVMGCL